MLLTGDIFRFFRNDQDCLNYSNLIQLIQESNCSAFVGAGLSVHAGYPTSNELINYLAAEGNIDPAEFNSLGDFSPDLLTFAFFRLFQGEKSNFQDTNGLVGDGLKLNAWRSSVR